VESVIVPAPRCCDDVLGFYDLELPAPPAKLSRSRQTSGRRPDYQSLGSSTHRLKLANALPDGGVPLITGWRRSSGDAAGTYATGAPLSVSMT
jgi:hypothetical protein